MKTTIAFLLAAGVCGTGCLDKDALARQSRNFSQKWHVALPTDWRDTTPDGFHGLIVANFNSSAGITVERLPGDESEHRHLIQSMIDAPAPKAKISTADITQFFGFSGHGRHVTIVQPSPATLKKEFVLFYPDGVAQGWYILASIESRPDDEQRVSEWRSVVQSLKFIEKPK